MQVLNVEIKARCADHEPIRQYLRAHEARFVGEDHQVDTYFRVPNGRLKLREGTIERALIHYDRADEHGPKRSDVHLYHPGAGDAPALKATLVHALGVRMVVDKRRAIYFIDNVKFHLDRVEGLGTFVEIEAIDREGHRTPEELRAQCEHYLDAFGIAPEDLVAASYCDMMEAMMEARARGSAA
ncbi:adenylate cyclase [Rhodothermaceae bacterium RA]|nr:adenylate cyclase [Rhodothermaceae bacterium RA]